MVNARVKADAITYGGAASACAQAVQWQHALLLLQTMRESWSAECLVMWGLTQCHKSTMLGSINSMKSIQNTHKLVINWSCWGSFTVGVTTNEWLGLARRTSAAKRGTAAGFPGTSWNSAAAVTGIGHIKNCLVVWNIVFSLYWEW